jgi:hypothetical protein
VKRKIRLYHLPIVEDFAKGVPIEAIAYTLKVDRYRIEAVIRKWMKEKERGVNGLRLQKV